MITRQYFERNADADKNAEKILELIENKHMFNHADAKKAAEISEEYIKEYMKTQDKVPEDNLHYRGKKWKEISEKIEKSIREYQENIKPLDICLEEHIDLNSQAVHENINRENLDTVEEYLKNGYKFSNKEYIEIKDDSEDLRNFDRVPEAAYKYESLANKISFNMYESVEELIYNMKLDEALKRIETGSPVDENCLRTFSKFSAGYLINENERSLEANKDKLRIYYKLYYILNKKTKERKQSKKSEEKTIALQIIPDEKYNAEELSLRINGTTVITDSDLKDVDENNIKKQISYLIGIKESEALKIKIYDVDDYNVDVTINQAKNPTCFIRLKQENGQANRLDENMEEWTIAIAQDDKYEAKNLANMINGQTFEMVNAENGLTHFVKEKVKAYFNSIGVDTESIRFEVGRTKDINKEAVNELNASLAGIYTKAKEKKKEITKNYAVQIFPDNNYNAEELAEVLNKKNFNFETLDDDIINDKLEALIIKELGFQEKPNDIKLEVFNLEWCSIDIVTSEPKRIPTSFITITSENTVKEREKVQKEEMEPFAKFKGEINERFASAYVAKDKLGNTYINYDPTEDEWQILPPFMYDMLKINLHKIDIGNPDDSIEMKVEKLIEKNDFKAAWDLYEGMEENQIKDDVFTKITEAQDKKMCEEHHEEMKNMGSVLEGIYKNGEFSEEERSGMTPIGTLDNEPLYYNEENYKKYNNPDNDDSNSTKKKVNSFKELMEEEDKPKKRKRLGI